MKKHCTHCGSEMEEGFVVCCSCGKVNQDSPPKKNNFLGTLENTEESNQNNSTTSNIKDDGSIVWLLLGIFLPFVGIILGVIWSKENPRNARMLFQGFILSIFLTSILMIFPFSCRMGF